MIEEPLEITLPHACLPFSLAAALISKTQDNWSQRRNIIMSHSEHVQPYLIYGFSMDM